MLPRRVAEVLEKMPPLDLAFALTASLKSRQSSNSQSL